MANFMVEWAKGRERERIGKKVEKDDDEKDGNNSFFSSSSVSEIHKSWSSDTHRLPSFTLSHPSTHPLLLPSIFAEFGTTRKNCTLCPLTHFKLPTIISNSRTVGSNFKAKPEPTTNIFVQHHRRQLLLNCNRTESIKCLNFVGDKNLRKVKMSWSRGWENNKVWPIPSTIYC